MSEAGSARHPDERRFEEFFIRDSYVTLKNYLYNYLERKRAINRVLDRERTGRLLEVGSGLSPIVTGRSDVIYSELSFRALVKLRTLLGMGQFVVADGTRLPFRDGALDQIVCSEVLEHIENDQVAIDEIARVLHPGGLACITVPHRKKYYAADDRYVRHFRRYEIDEMRGKLDHAGLDLRRSTPVLGPLEKATMWTLVTLLTRLERRRANEDKTGTGMNAFVERFRGVLHPVFKYAHRVYAVLARADAAIAPRAYAAVMLFEAVKPTESESS